MPRLSSSSTAGKASRSAWTSPGDATTMRSTWTCSIIPAPSLLALSDAALRLSPAPLLTSVPAESTFLLAWVTIENRPHEESVLMRPVLTHLALHVRDLDTSIAFYRDYCGMQVVHERVTDGRRVVWLAEPGREQEFIFVLV